MLHKGPTPNEKKAAWRLVKITSLASLQLRKFEQFEESAEDVVLALLMALQKKKVIRRKWGNDGGADADSNPFTSQYLCTFPVHTVLA